MIVLVKSRVLKTIGGTGVFDPGSGGLVTKYDSSAIMEGLREIRVVGETGVFDPGSVGVK